MPPELDSFSLLKERLKAQIESLGRLNRDIRAGTWMPLHLVKGTPPPDTPTERVRKRVRAMKRPAAMLQCPRCGGREMIQTRIGVLQGRPKSGTPADLCASCLMRGERVVVT